MQEQTNHRLPPTERQAQIAELAMREGSVSAAQVAAEFGVSLMTAHRDLDALAQRGVVRRFHGGVSALPSNVFDSNIKFRSHTRLNEKAAIANAARALVEPGMTVMLEDSTTVLALAHAIVDIEPLTVITNFPAITDVFAPSHDVRLIVLGGEYSRSHAAHLGLTCVEAVSNIRADIHFNSTSALTSTHAYHSDPDVVLVKRAMIEASDRSVLLADHTKYGRTAIHTVAPLSRFDDLIIDDGLDADSIRSLREHHSSITVARETGLAQPRA